MHSMERENSIKSFSDKQLFEIMSKKENMFAAKLAYNEIYTRYSVQIFNSAIKLLSNEMNREEIAKQVVQDTFTKVWLNSKSFKGDNKAIFWIYKIAENALIDIIREKDKNITYVDEYYDSYLSEDIDDIEDYEEEISIEKQIFNIAWNKLSKLEQEVLRTYYRYYDFSDEIKNQHIPKQEKEIICKLFKIKNPDYLSKIRIRAIKKLYKYCNISVDTKKN